jgi:hypothetical protein
MTLFVVALNLLMMTFKGLLESPGALCLHLDLSRPAVADIGVGNCEKAIRPPQLAITPGRQ